MSFDRVALVAGTRPEFVKLHPVALALEAAKIPHVLIATNQHRGALMKDAFLEQLRWPCDIQTLAVNARDPLLMLGEIVGTLPSYLRAGDLVMNPTTLTVSMHGRPIPITRLEYSILDLLVQNRGRVVPYSRLIAYAWGYTDEGAPSLLKSHVYHLRKKLGLNADRAKLTTEHFSPPIKRAEQLSLF